MILRRWLLAKWQKTVAVKRRGVAVKDISPNAVAVARKLQKNNFQAYVVGGAVRDLLLGFKPKDFDIATSARPEEIKKLFKRQARIIGRRFRLAHIYFYDKSGGRELIEVATFRADTGHASSPASADNNVYGDQEEDARRRDFTVNGIFYDPVSGEIVDYVNGVKDIGAQTLRMIGDSKKRLPEDPVRVLRGLRLANKLGLKPARGLLQEFGKCAPLLANIPPARLFDEFIKALKCGASARILEEWQRHEAARYILPILEQSNPFFFSVLAENDRRMAEGRAASVSFAVAALFWPHVADLWHRHRANGGPSLRAMEKAMATDIFAKNKLIPQRVYGFAKDLFFMQAQMEDPPTPRRAARLIKHPAFDRALAFAAQRQDSGAARVASWWSQYVAADAGERERMINMLPAPPRKRRRRRRAAKAPA